MKKNTVLTAMSLLLLMFFQNINAQNKISFVTGLQTSNVSASGLNTDLINFQPINRLTAGVIYERELDQLLSFKTGVHLKQKGFQVSESMNINVLDFPLPLGVKVITEVNTIDVPLLLQFNFIKGSIIAPYIAIGPNLSYATSGSINTRATAILDFGLTQNSLNLDSDDYNRLGVEAMVNVGASIPYGAGAFIMDLNYTRGMNDFVNENFIVDTGIRTSGLGFSLGYSLNF